MALECAHCGTRCDDGATRCPKCLRTTHLVAVADDAPRRSRKRVIAPALVVIAVVAAGAWVASNRHANAPSAARVPDTVPSSAADPLAVGDDLRPLVERARNERDATARARTVAEAVQERRRANVITEDGEVPPPRAPDLLWRVLPAERERVTELDLARLIAGVLRAAGDDTAAVAERVASTRPDEPIDPSGVLGSYVVVTHDHVADTATGTLVAKSEVRHRALTPASLAGAISAQAALETALSSARDRALQYANAAVEAWPDSPAPLASRARVWLAVGGTSGLSLADADLRAAIALRDDAPLHLARARVLLLQDDLVQASREVARARSMAPAWGMGSLAALAFREVYTRLDAGVADGCAGLRSARAPWTDDAYALCGEGVSPEVRERSARRLLDTSTDPLRVAWAAAALPDGTLTPERVREGLRRETARWLMLFGRPEVAMNVLGIRADGGR